jgi:hypothetical protein
MNPYRPLEDNYASFDLIQIDPTFYGMWSYLESGSCFSFSFLGPTVAAEETHLDFGMNEDFDFPQISLSESESWIVENRNAFLLG